MLEIVDYIGSDPSRFEALVQLLLAGEYRITQRGAWPLSYCIRAHPELIRKHLSHLVVKLETSDNNALIRNILRFLKDVDIPASESGQVMTVCFDLVQDPAAPAAHRAFALSILGRLAEHYPDIREEIRLCIEDQLPYAKPSFRSTARRVLASFSGGKKSRKK
ncbi:hypothetical protein GCM10023143_11690 [Compostibacter hankyongensis]|uniref:HEAT repeat domain-containing protein n=2 Tax=Compostibacter hankyongensis TaxID=1007089 RepID=A0ABP8FL34_9BACT